jgi:hypothetical protein
VNAASVAGVAAAADAEVVLAEVPLHMAPLAHVTGPELLLEHEASADANPAATSPPLRPTFWIRMFFLLGRAAVFRASCSN